MLNVWKTHDEICSLKYLSRGMDVTPRPVGLARDNHRDNLRDIHRPIL